MENNNTTPTNKGAKPGKSSCLPRATSPNRQFNRYVNERFNMTPESMGLDRGTDTPRPCPQHSAPRAEISYERHHIKQRMTTPQGLKQEYIMQSLLSSNSASPSGTYDTESMQRENLQQTALSYNQQFLTQQSLPTNLYSTLNLESLQQQLSCENRQETTQPQSSFGNNNNPCSSSQQSTQSNIYSCNNLPNHTCSELPMSSSATASHCNITCMPSASSTLKCLKSPVPLNSDSTVPLAADNQQCCHASNSSTQNMMSEIPTAHYEQLLQKYKSGNSAHGIGVLNAIFLKRLQEIDAEAQGDSDLKLITYQEWVDMLLNVNDTILTNMEELESEVAERLQLLQRKITTNCRHSQGNELMKCRKDIDTLIKFIQNAYKFNNWDLKSITFETINSDQILGSGETQSETVYSQSGGVPQLKAANDAESMNTNKLLANISALAFEVAEKHDEVIQLKQQMISMEDEIQKAYQKIQLKDDVIKELRNDLKCGHNKLPHRGSLEEACLEMPPINLENQSSRSVTTQLSECNQLMSQDDTASQFDSLSHTEQEEQLKLKILDKELKDLFTINQELNNSTKQKMQGQCQRLKDIFKDVETEKAVAYRKLDFIRRQLIDLESSSSEGVNDFDSGFHSKSENDQDAKILDSVRRRLHNLKETIFELKKRLQKLELENNELSTCLQSEKSFSQLSSETIKQVADLLCEMRGQQFSCTDFYNTTQSGMNPFCEAIKDMQREFKERELQCLHMIGMRNKTIEELTQTLINKEKMFDDQQRTCLNIIDLEQLNTTTLPPTTPPPPIPSLATASATILTGQEPQNTTTTK